MYKDCATGAREWSVISYDKLFLEWHGVKEIIHFTTVDNLESILNMGAIVPREKLDGMKKYDFNDSLCLDGKDNINCSISYPNVNLFYRFKRNNPGLEFVVLGISLDALTGVQHWFSSTNAASRKAENVLVEELFKGDRDNLPNDATTDNQAEVVFMDKIDVKYINHIYVNPISNNADRINELARMNGIEIENTGFHHEYHNSLVGTDNIFGRNNPLQNNFRIHQEWLNKWFLDSKEATELSEAIRSIRHISRFDSEAYSATEVKNYYNKGNSNCKFKIEYSRPELNSSSAFDDNAKLSALAVIEKIINRGKIARLSKHLEESINSLLIKQAHQLQVILVELLKVGTLRNGTTVAFAGADGKFYSNIDEPLKDLKELSRNVCLLYGVESIIEGVNCVYNEEADVIITYSQLDKFDTKKCVVISELSSKDKVERDFIKVQNQVKIQSNIEALEFLLEYIYMDIVVLEKIKLKVLSEGLTVRIQLYFYQQVRAKALFTSCCI